MTTKNIQIYNAQDIMLKLMLKFCNRKRKGEVDRVFMLKILLITNRGDQSSVATQLLA